MLLVDKDIKQLLESNRIAIFSTREDVPFEMDKQVGPGSIDLRLSNNFRRYKADISHITGTSDNPTEAFIIDDEEEITIQPKEIILAATLENVVLPADVAAFITGRSSIARLGLMVQVTQDFIQPGSKALIPLQLVNVTSYPIKIKPLLRICQIMLFQTSSNAERAYSDIPEAKYRNETSEPSESRLHTEVNPAEVTRSHTDKTQDSLLKEIEALKQLVERKNKQSELISYVRRLTFIIYVVLSVSVGVLLSEIRNSQFPSVAFYISGFVVVLCIILIGVSHLKR